MHRQTFIVLLVLEALMLHTTLSEIRDTESNENDTVRFQSVEKRSAKTQTTYASLFAATLATDAIALTKGPVPFLAASATFVIGSLVNILWREDTYEQYRAKFIEDIRREMNYQSTERMRMKLDDYRKQLKGLFDLVKLPPNLVQEWYDSVKEHGLVWLKQRTELLDVAELNDFKLFKDKILALTADIRNDRNDFFIPIDPFNSLAFYREYASLELLLLTTELLLHSEYPASTNAQTYTRNAIRSAAETHFRFVYWAAHKSAGVLETKTRQWYQYNNVVQSVLSQFPLDEWKKAANINWDDTKYLRNMDVVSFKMVSLYYDSIPRGHFGMARIEDKSSHHYRWMSCWVSGSACTTRTCPGEDKPFDTGDEYQYYWKCRGEVFWIYADGRHARDYIRTCDAVAIQYSYQNGNGYWLGFTQGWWDAGHFKTNTCPGKNFLNSNFNGQCGMEVFKLHVEGKSCGEIVQDRDVLKFEQNYGCVASKGGSLYKYWKFNQWRVFKHGSFIKTPHS